MGDHSRRKNRPRPYRSGSALAAAGIIAASVDGNSGNGGQANGNNGADERFHHRHSNADNLTKSSLTTSHEGKGHFDQGKYDDCIGVLKS